MNVLVLATDAWGGYGGIAQYNRDFVEALALWDRVARVDVLVRLGRPGRDQTLPPQVIQHPPVFTPALYAARALELVLQKRPHVVVSAHLYHGPLAAIIASVTSARLVSQLHGTEVWGAIAPRHLAPIERSDIVFCVSRDTRARLIAQARMPGERAVVVANTVGESFTPGDREAARRSLGLGSERMILTVARLDGRAGYKGHDRVIRALPDLQSLSNGHVVYWIAGDGENRPRLEALARSLNVADRVRFLGKVPDALMPDLYRAADLFALPSTGEGFGIVFLEAMACGTPAIGLAVGGAKDALGDGRLGWCIHAEDFPNTLANAMERPSADPGALHDAVMRRFGRSAFQDRIATLLTNLAPPENERPVT